VLPGSGNPCLLSAYQGPPNSLSAGLGDDLVLCGVAVVFEADGFDGADVPSSRLAVCATSWLLEASWFSVLAEAELSWAGWVPRFSMPNSLLASLWLASVVLVE
jgi:hypothetical protein